MLLKLQARARALLWFLLNPIKMENPNFIFSSGPVELKEEGKDFFVEGYISTSDLDLVNDIVTKSCILDMAEQMKKRTIKLDIEHESFRGNNEVELEINKTIIPAAKMDDFSVDKKGLKVRAKLNKHIKRFDEVKGSIKDGFLDAFSIAYIPTETKTEFRNGQEIRLLDKIKLLNVAFTGNPVNTYSTMTNIFAKSLEFLKDQENHIHASDDITKLKEVKKMSEEDNKEETQEAEKTEEPSKPESKEKAKKPEKEEEEEETEKKKKKVSKKDEDESESEEESTEESKESESEESETETKSEIEKLKKEMMEVKAVLKRPLLKSRVEQQDKSGNFAEEKALNPLDIIA